MHIKTTVSTTMTCGTLSNPSWSSKVTGRRCPTPSLSVEKRLCLRMYMTKQTLLLRLGRLEEAVLNRKHMNNCAVTVFSFSSTDSQLKLWNVNKPHCLRSFKGHINEKNFVGLASNGDYVACGEWAYYTPLAKTQLFSHHFIPCIAETQNKHKSVVYVQHPVKGCLLFYLFNDTDKVFWISFTSDFLRIEFY